MTQDPKDKIPPGTYIITKVMDLPKGFGKYEIQEGEHKGKTLRIKDPNAFILKGVKRK